MRILALVTDCFGGYGGIAQYNRDLMAALSSSARINEVIVMSRIGEANEALPNKIVQLQAISGRVQYSLAALSCARRCGPFDVILCGHIFLIPLASAISKLMKLPLWLQIHGIDAWEPPSKLVQHFVQDAALVTAVSRYTRHRFLSWAKIAPERVKVLPNTVNLDLHKQTLSAPVSLNYPFTGQPYLITVARINKEDEYKGHRRVIAVLCELRTRHPDLQYLVVGDGDDAQNILAYAASAGVGDAVHLLGRLPSEQVSSLLDGAAAFVMPSTKEGFGIVYLEAAAHGIPVIAGNKDGSVDALCDGAIGTLVDPSNLAELSRTLSDAIEGKLYLANSEALGRFAPRHYQAHVDALLGLFPKERLRPLPPSSNKSMAAVR